MKTPIISEELIVQKRIAIGARLKEVRVARGLTVDELAGKSNLDKYTIERMEAGRWNYDIKMLIIYGEFLDFDIKLDLN